MVCCLLSGPLWKVMPVVGDNAQRGHIITRAMALARPQMHAHGGTGRHMPFTLPRRSLPKTFLWLWAHLSNGLLARSHGC